MPTINYDEADATGRRVAYPNVPETLATGFPWYRLNPVNYDTVEMVGQRLTFSMTDGDRFATVELAQVEGIATSGRYNGLIVVLRSKTRGELDRTAVHFSWVGGFSFRTVGRTVHGWGPEGPLTVGAPLTDDMLRTVVRHVDDILATWYLPQPIQ